MPSSDPTGSVSVGGDAFQVGEVAAGARNPLSLTDVAVSPDGAAGGGVAATGAQIEGAYENPVGYAGATVAEDATGEAVSHAPVPVQDAAADASVASEAANDPRGLVVGEARSEAPMDPSAGFTVTTGGSASGGVDAGGGTGTTSAPTTTTSAPTGPGSTTPNPISNPNVVPTTRPKK